MLFFQSEEQTPGGMKPKNSKVVGSCLSAVLKSTQAEALNQGLPSGGTGLSCTFVHITDLHNSFGEIYHARLTVLTHTQCQQAIT